MRLALPSRHLLLAAIVGGALATVGCSSGGSSSSSGSTGSGATSGSGTSSSSTTGASSSTSSGSSGSTSTSGGSSSTGGSGSSGSSGSTWNPCSTGYHSCPSGCCPWQFIDTGFGTSDASAGVTFDASGLAWWAAFHASSPWAGIPSGAGGWSAVQIASSSAQYGDGASVVMLGPSRVGVAWTTTDGFFWSTSQDDGGFDTVQLPGGLAGNSFQELVAKLDLAGQPHIVEGLSSPLPDGGALGELTYLRPLPDGGAQIDADLFATSYGQNVPDVDLAYAPDGTPRLVMIASNALVYARGEPDGGFVVSPLTGFGDLPLQPSVAVDPAGTTHLLFSARDHFPDGGAEWHLRHAEGEDATWSIETVDAAGWRLSPSLQIGADGELQALYLEPVITSYVIWYARRVAGVWHVDAVTPGDALVPGPLRMTLDPAGAPAFMLDENNKLYLVRW